MTIWLVFQNQVTYRIAQPIINERKWWVFKQTHWFAQQPTQREKFFTSKKLAVPMAKFVQYIIVL